MNFGIGVSPGIAMGRVLLKLNSEIKIEKLTVEDYQQEINKLEKAREKSKQEIQLLYDKTLQKIGENEAEIFQAHSMIVDDVEIFEQVKDKITSVKVNADWALKEVTDGYIELFSGLEDDYLRERGIDIQDVTARITRHLLGLVEIDYASLEESVIIVAEDITPSDTAKMTKECVLAFITEKGGKTSHSAIMARSMEIPAVVGCRGILNMLKDGDFVIIDGKDASVLINPTVEKINEYKEKSELYNKYKSSLRDYIGKESKTKDGRNLEISANIGTSNDLAGVIKNDADGVGLFRTEFLYMDRQTLPSEEEQFESYKKVVKAMKGKAVIIRTLDIGGDKELEYMNLPKEMNPFLGYRAIRLCLDRKDIFTTQLRALLRASNFGNLKIMFPMISSMDELLEAKKILNETKRILHREGVLYNSDIEIGMMIEIPSAAIISDLLAKEVDFFSIGTNDLIQYTLAVDRGNENLSNLYTPFHPAVLRLIKKVIDSGHENNIWVGMCGEVAGNPLMIPLLAGMGLDEFSMSPISILQARSILSNVDTSEWYDIIRTILDMTSAEEVEKYLKNNLLCQYELK